MQLQLTFLRDEHKKTKKLIFLQDTTFKGYLSEAEPLGAALQAEPWPANFHQAQSQSAFV